MEPTPSHEPRRRGRPAARRIAPDALRGKVRAHDPFELIRWLACSQTDPRKALAELVQNSLDAGARHVRITRVRERGLPALRVLDDGEGVIPELGRREALQYIATNIGHSRKRSLSLQERYQLMTQGQYGIGLLGFWSLGEILEMRTALPGQEPHRLLLYRDKQDFVVEPLRGRLLLEERFTEVVVLGLHRASLGILAARRAADYLASELRGQLLAREVELVIEDRMARGRAQKLFAVRPPRFLGERLPGLGPVEVPGHASVRLEIYLGSENDGQDGAHGIAVYAAGTLAAPSFHDLGALDLDHEPWTDARLTGLVDFPDFQVAPGSRRGIVVDEAAEAFAQAMRSLEPLLRGILEHLDRQRAEELDRNMIRDLQRAFRDFYRQRPRYELLPLQDPKAPGRGGEGAGGGSGEGSAAAGAAVEATEEEALPLAPVAELLPSGPLALVHLVPSKLRVVARGLRTVRALPLDAGERPVTSAVEFAWGLEGPVGVLLDDEQGRADRVRFHAAEEAAEGVLVVMATAGGLEARAEALVEVVDEAAARRASEGIPEPEFVHHPGASWRSRMLERRWQVNTAHPEYRAIADRPVLKLRYLAMLFAKEVVLRSHQDPRLEEPLEQLVEVAAYADRNLATGRPGRQSRGARAAVSKAPEVATD